MRGILFCVLSAVGIYFSFAEVVAEVVVGVGAVVVVVIVLGVFYGLALSSVEDLSFWALPAA